MFSETVQSFNWTFYAFNHFYIGFTGLLPIFVHHRIYTEIIPDVVFFGGIKVLEYVSGSAFFVYQVEIWHLISGIWTFLYLVTDNKWSASHLKTATTRMINWIKMCFLFLFLIKLKSHLGWHICQSTSISILGAFFKWVLQYKWLNCSSTASPISKSSKLAKLCFNWIFIHLLLI